MPNNKQWKTVDLLKNNLVGSKEACELLGISKMQLNRWKRPGSGRHLPFGGFGTNRSYMCEWVEVAATPVWHRDDVLRHRDEVGRQRAPSD